MAGHTILRQERWSTAPTGRRTARVRLQGHEHAPRVPRDGSALPCCDVSAPSRRRRAVHGAVGVRGAGVPGAHQDELQPVLVQRARSPSGAMSLEQVLEYCAEIGFDAVDPTGYYFKGYPDGADRRADLPDQAPGVQPRTGDQRHRRPQRLRACPTPRSATPTSRTSTRWVEVAAKLGAPVLRVFDGKVMPAGVPKATVMDWIVDGIQRCVTAGEGPGVMIVLQNHNDALKVAGDYLEIRTRIPSPWFGLNVDIGSLRTTDDPYAEIALLAPHAYTWQVKELVYRRDKEERVDLKQVARILQGRTLPRLRTDRDARPRRSEGQGPALPGRVQGGHSVTQNAGPAASCLPPSAFCVLRSAFEAMASSCSATRPSASGRRGVPRRPCSAGGWWPARRWT